MEKATERRTPTGRQPAGIQGVTTERVFNIASLPCKNNPLHDPHECRCPPPCPACHAETEPFPRFIPPGPIDRITTAGRKAALLTGADLHPLVFQHIDRAVIAALYLGANFPADAIRQGVATQ